MKCIHNHYQILSTFSHLKLMNNSKPPKQLWLPIKEPTYLFRKHNFSSIPTQRTHAFNHSYLVLGLTSSTSSSIATTTGPNIIVFIATSALLLLLYWIANFFVPSIVVKHFDSMDAKDKQASEDNNLVNVQRPAESSGLEQSSKL